MGSAHVEEIFAQHHGFVWRVVRRLGVPEAEADDVVQEIFVVLYRRRNELEIGVSARALLYGIARRVAGRQRRSDQRYVARLRTVEATATPPSHGDPEQRVLLEERAAVVRDALDAMDEDKRIMFEMTQVEGMSVPEASEIVGINVNTGYARARAARDLVRRAIARHRAREERQRVHATR